MSPSGLAISTATPVLHITDDLVQEVIIMKKTRQETREWAVWPPESPHLHTRRRIERACPGNRPTLMAFAGWLAEERELAPRTITLRLGSACTFVDAVTAGAGTTCVRAVQAPNAHDVEDFFIRYASDHGTGARRLAPLSRPPDYPASLGGGPISIGRIPDSDAHRTRDNHRLSRKVRSESPGR